MKYIYTLSIICTLSVHALNAQIPPALQWQRSLGGGQEDYISAACPTTDGGMVVLGSTLSDDGFVHGHHGWEDLWIVRLNAGGDTVWTKSLGGSNYDGGNDVQQTTDGGFIIVGHTLSNDGDVHGSHGEDDVWVIKLNPGGDTAWTRCYGGSDSDYGFSIRQTTDGGYILAARAESNDGDITGRRGDFDVWLAKLDATGNITWSRCLGGSEEELPRSVRAVADGGYIIAATTSSNDFDVIGYHGSTDYWIVKVNATGAIEWQKCFGGSYPDDVGACEPTADGGYIVSGGAFSNDGDVTGHRGFFNYDAWILKLDAAGQVTWKKCFGGTGEEQAFGIAQTTDGGYIFTGPTSSNNMDVSGNHGGYDIWAVKLDPDGVLQWQRCFGGSSHEYAYGVFQTADRGYFISGGTQSSDIEVTTNNGLEDIWALKLAPDPLLLPVTLIHFSAHLRPAGDVLLQWKTSSEENSDWFEIQRSTNGNNFAVIGQVAASGYSSIEKSYSYIDAAAQSAEKIYYRLRMVDADGREKLSPVVWVKPRIDPGYAIGAVFPNPAISQVNLSVQAAQREKLTIQVIDISGKIVSQQVNTVEQGTTIVPVKVGGLTTGIYSIKAVFSPSNQTLIAQFIKH